MPTPPRRTASRLNLGAASGGGGTVAITGEWSVLALGARGDGVTDDTAAIQAAIDYVAARHGCLYFPPAVYQITQTIHWRQSMKVRGIWGYWPGAGMVTRDGSELWGSVLRWAGAANSVITDAIGVTALQIEGLTFHGNSVPSCTGLLYDAYNYPGAWTVFGSGTPITVSVTNGSTAITFSASLAPYYNPDPGDHPSIVVGGAGQLGFRITSPTTGVLDAPWTGATNAAASFSILEPTSSGVSIDYCSFIYIGTVTTDQAGWGVGLQAGRKHGDPSHHAQQCDSLWVRHFSFYAVATAVKFSAWNSVQGSAFRDGSFAGCVRGAAIDITGGLLTFDNIDGSLVTLPGIECAWFEVGDTESDEPDPGFPAGWGIHGPIQIRNCQCESGWGVFLRVVTSYVQSAITLQGCTTDHPIRIAANHRLISIGNNYDCDFQLTDPNVRVVSCMDNFLNPTTAGYVFPSGTTSAGSDFFGATVAVVNGSSAVTFSIPLYANFYDRGTITLDGGTTNYTLTFTSPTQATLDRPYAGATNAAAAFSIPTTPRRAFIPASGLQMSDQVTVVDALQQDIDTINTTLAAVPIRTEIQTNPERLPTSFADGYYVMSSTGILNATGGSACPDYNNGWILGFALAAYPPVGYQLFHGTGGSAPNQNLWFRGVTDATHWGPWINITAGVAGPAGGDLSGSYPDPTVATVGTSTAADIHTAEQLANAATDAATPGALVKRDSGGKSAFLEVDVGTVGSSGSPTGQVNLLPGDGTLTGKLELMLPNGAVVANLVAGALEVDFNLATGYVFFYFRGGAGVFLDHDPSTMPTTSGAVVTVDGAQHLTGKTIDAAVNTLLNLPVRAETQTSPERLPSSFADGSYIMRSVGAVNATGGSACPEYNNGWIFGFALGAYPSAGYQIFHGTGGASPNQNIWFRGATDGSHWGPWVNLTGGASGPASGDLSGSYPNPTVAIVGGSTAANIHAAEQGANAATSAATPSTIVARDSGGKSSFLDVDVGTTGSSGTGQVVLHPGDGTLTGKVSLVQPNGSEVANLVAGALEVDLNLASGYVFFFFRGGAGVFLDHDPATMPTTSGAVVTTDGHQTLTSKTIDGTHNTITNVPPGGSAGGDLSGTYPNPTVATVGTSSAANIHAAEQAANAATFANTSGAIVKRDSGGGFVATEVTYDAAAGNFRGVVIETGGVLRWALYGSNEAETGSNAGTNFILYRYSDAGAYLGAVFTVTRSTGAVDFTGPLTVGGAAVAFVSTTAYFGTGTVTVDGAAGNNRGVVIKTAGVLRWILYGTSDAESGSNAGTNLALYRYTDAGGYLGTVLTVNRASGTVDIASLTVGGVPVLTSGTAGGDLTGTYPNPTLKSTGTAGTYTKVTTDAQGRVSAGAQAASTDLSDSSSLVRVNGLGTYSGNATGNVLSLLVGGANPPAGMYRVSAYIANTSTATGNLIVQVNYTNPGGISSGLQFLPAMGTGSLGGVGGDIVIYTNGSAVNINVTISNGSMPSYTVATTLERLL